MGEESAGELVQIKAELAAIAARIEAGTATGRDFNRQRALLMQIRGEHAAPVEGGVCSKLADWTRGKVTH